MCFPNTRYVQWQRVLDESRLKVSVYGFGEVFTLILVFSSFGGFTTVVLSFFSDGGFTTVVLLSFFSAGGLTVVVFCSHAENNVMPIRTATKEIKGFFISTFSSRRAESLVVLNQMRCWEWT